MGAVTLEEVKVLLDAELGPFKKKMADAKKEASSLKSAFGKLKNVLIGFGIARAVQKVGQYSTQMALEVEAAMNQVKRTMGESSQMFLKWADENANSFAISKGEAIKYGSVFSNLFEVFVKDTNQLADYTRQTLEASAVIASATGRSITDVMERIRSGMLGSTEAIEDLGVYVNVAMIESTRAFKELSNGRSWAQLDFQTQQLIRLMAILEQTSDRYGNTLANNVNTQIARFKALMKDSALNLGNAMLPAINAIMPVLNSFASALKKATSVLATFMELLFGKNLAIVGGGGGGSSALSSATSDLSGFSNSLGGASSGASDFSSNLSGAKSSATDFGNSLGSLSDDADDFTSSLSGMKSDASELDNSLSGVSDGANNLADNVGGAGKAAKKAAKELKALMGFDEINKLPSADSGGGGGGGKGGKGGKGGGGGAGEGLPEVITTNDIFEDDNKLVNTLNGIIGRLHDLANLFKFGFNDVFQFEGLDHLKDSLAELKELLIEIFTAPEVIRASELWANKVAIALGRVTGSVANVGLAVAILFVDSILKFVSDNKERIKRDLVDLFDIYGDTAEYFGKAMGNFSKIIYEALTNPNLSDIGGHIASSIYNGFVGVWKVSLKLNRDIFKGISELFDDVKTDALKAWDGMLNALKPAFESLDNMIKNSMDKMNDVYDTYISPAIDRIWDGITDLGKKLFQFWDTYVNPPLKRLSENLKALFEWMQPTIDKTIEVIGMITSAISILWKNILAPFLGWITGVAMAAIGHAIDIIGTIVVGTAGVIGTVIKFVVFVLHTLLTFVKNLFQTDWAAVWEAIVNAVKLAVEIIKSVVELILIYIASKVINALSAVGEGILFVVDKIAGAVRFLFNVVVEIFSPILEFFVTILKGVLDFLIGVFTGDWERAWEGVKTVTSAVVDAIKLIFKILWDGIKAIFAPVGKWFGDKFTEAKKAIETAFSKIGSWFGQRWGDIKNAFSQVGSWFSTTFKTGYTNATNAFSGIRGFFKSKWTDIKSVFSDIGSWFGSKFKTGMDAARNAVSRGVGVLKGLMKFKWSLPKLKLPHLSISGGFGINPPRVPKFGIRWYQRGGVFNNPSIIGVGENGREAVMPLEKNTGWISELAGKIESLMGTGNNGTNHIVVNVAGKNMYDEVIDYINNKSRMHGKTVIDIG